MDEMKAKPIPGKAPLFGRQEAKKPAPAFGGNKLVDTFVNDDGTKAVNLVLVEETEDDTAKKLTHEDLVEYANGLMDGEEDTRDLMVGAIFNGEDAEDKARKVADGVNENLAPEPDATDDELLDAAEQAKENKEGAEVPELPKVPTPPSPEKNLGDNLPKPSFGNFSKAPEKKKTPEDVEDEPMLKQFGGK